MARSSHPWMNLFSLKMWRHRTSEKRLWHFESKNRSTAESRFGRPKFEQQVEIFYRKVIVDKKYKSDLVLTYQKRFIRYKDSLFTFLTEDGIPWHNNTAERGIQPFAI